MFDSNSIGKTVKTLAKVLMWLAVIGLIITAFIFFKHKLWMNGIVYLVFAAMSPIYGLILYGFGDLIESSRETAARLDMLYNKIGTAQNNSLLNNTQQQGTIAANSTQSDMNTAPSVSTVPKPVPNNEGLITCPACKRKQKSDRTVCWDCGAKLI